MTISIDTKQIDRPCKSDKLCEIYHSQFVFQIPLYFYNHDKRDSSDEKERSGKTDSTSKAYRLHDTAKTPLCPCSYGNCCSTQGRGWRKRRSIFI